MFAVDSVFVETVSGVSMQNWPAEGRRAMQELLASEMPAGNRRYLVRNRYHLQTEMLVTGQREKTFPVYTRDINAWTVGFISRVALKWNEKTVIRLLTPDGRSTAVGCRIRRCREFQSGWFDTVAELCQPRYCFDVLPD